MLRPEQEVDSTFKTTPVTLVRQVGAQNFIVFQLNTSSWGPSVHPHEHVGGTSRSNDSTHKCRLIISRLVIILNKHYVDSYYTVLFRE